MPPTGPCSEPIPGLEDMAPATLALEACVLTAPSGVSWRIAQKAR